MIGGARKRVLSLAAREADIVSISNVPFTPVNDAGLTPAEEAARRLGFVRDAAGDRFADLDIESSPFFTEITDDVAASVDRVARMVRIAGRRPARASERAHRIRRRRRRDGSQERRERFGVNYVSVQQTQVESFAPVVARLAGPVAPVSGRRSRRRRGAPPR